MIDTDEQHASRRQWIIIISPSPNIHPLVKEKLVKRRERANSILLHYTHGKRTIHQLWNDTYHNADVNMTKLIVDSRNPSSEETR